MITGAAFPVLPIIESPEIANEFVKRWPSLAKCLTAGRMLNLATLELLCIPELVRKMFPRQQVDAVAQEAVLLYQSITRGPWVKFVKEELGFKQSRPMNGLLKQPSNNRYPCVAETVSDYTF